MEELWSTLLYSVASVHWGLQGFVYVQFCQGPAPVFKSGWGLDFGLLGHLDSLLFSVVLLEICCFAWDHCSSLWPSLVQALSVAQMASCVYRVLWYTVHGPLSDWKVPKPSSLHHGADSWSQVFGHSHSEIIWLNRLPVFLQLPYQLVDKEAIGAGFAPQQATRSWTIGRKWSNKPQNPVWGVTVKLDGCKIVAFVINTQSSSCFILDLNMSSIPGAVISMYRRWNIQSGDSDSGQTNFHPWFDFDSLIKESET